MKPKVIEIELKVARIFGQWRIDRTEHYSTGVRNHRVIAVYSSHKKAFDAFKEMIGEG